MKKLPSLTAIMAGIVAATALAAGSETLLFVDDHDVLYRPGTRRVLHQPKRHPENPLIEPPTLKNQIAYSSVYRDPSNGKYKLWYQIGGNDCVVCYAESADGLHWTKPDLGLIKVKGIAEPNIVLASPNHYGASIVVDSQTQDAEQRYKIAYCSVPPWDGPWAHPTDHRGPNGGMFIAFSPDGIHWIKKPDSALRASYGRPDDPPFAGEKYPWGDTTSVSDVIDTFYDQRIGKFVTYAKGWMDGPDGKTFWKRNIVRSESSDFLRWSAPQIVMAPDEYDGLRPADYPGTRRGVQLHGSPTFFHHGVYFALLQIADFETHGLQPIELAISRDGISWSRPFRQTLFLPAGQPGDFDAGRIWSNATPVMKDDEMHFYYGAYESPWQFGKGESPWGAKKRLPKSGIGLASMPLDRFVSVRPITRIGQITMRPRSLTGISALTLNADAASGSIRIELLNAAGRRLHGFSKADAVPLTGNNLRHAVTWKATDLTKLPAGEVMIRIHLDNAEAFAITLQ